MEKRKGDEITTKQQTTKQQTNKQQTTNKTTNNQTTNKSKKQKHLTDMNIFMYISFILKDSLSLKYKVNEFLSLSDKNNYISLPITAPFTFLCNYRNLSK